MNKTKIISIALFLFSTSCSTYQKTSVPLSQAVNKGKVKTESSLGTETYFKNIEVVDNTYYGVNGKRRIILNDLAVPHVYLLGSDKSAHQIWVKTIGSNLILEGYLYAVKDSSILVSQNPPSLFTEKMTPITKIEVSTIQALRLREVGKIGRTVRTGALIGMGVGVALSLPVALSDGWGGSGWTIAGAILFGSVGSLTGLIVGVDKKEYRIERSQIKFEGHKTILNEKSFTQ